MRRGGAAQGEGGFTETVEVITTVTVCVCTGVVLTVAVGVGMDRQLHADERSEHAYRFNSVGTPSHLTGGNEVVDGLLVVGGFVVVVGGLPTFAG